MTFGNFEGEVVRMNAVDTSRRLAKVTERGVGIRIGGSSSGGRGGGAVEAYGYHDDGKKE